LAAISRCVFRCDLPRLNDSAFLDLPAAQIDKVFVSARGNTESTERMQKVALLMTGTGSLSKAFSCRAAGGNEQVETA
jgi:hypothetical protein